MYLKTERNSHCLWCLDSMIGKAQSVLSFIVRPAGLGHSAAPEDTPEAVVAVVAFHRGILFLSAEHHNNQYVSLLQTRLWKCMHNSWFI